MCPYVTNIQKYSVHDGEGIRTTIFFKGCPLRCMWCHNPETQSFENEFWVDGEAVAAERSVEELVKEVLKDRIFYDESGGGVTLSGGEVLSQDIDFVSELIERLDKEGISIYIDTCGAVPYENIVRVKDKVSAFLYDIKLMDSKLHRKYTGAGNEEILENLKRLSRDGAGIFIRVPIIPGLSGTEENISRMAGFLADSNINVRGINLLPYHDTGSGKYQRLGRSYEGTGFAAPGINEMKKYIELLKTAGFKNVKTGG